MSQLKPVIRQDQCLSFKTAEALKHTMDGLPYTRVVYGSGYLVTPEIFKLKLPANPLASFTSSHMLTFILVLVLSAKLKGKTEKREKLMHTYSFTV